MYKVITLRDYDKDVEIKEFETKPEAIAMFLELVNKACEKHAMLSQYIRRDDEKLIRGDLFFAREDKYHKEYIIIIGDGLFEFRNYGKYKQIIKEYVNHLL